MSLSSGKRPLPTKIELIRVKRSLIVARSVHKILEDKRDVLLKRIDDMIGEASKARDEMGEPLSSAYRALYNAYLSLGPARLESIAETTPLQIDVDVDVRVIVDVKVPTLTINDRSSGLTYGFADTNSYLDDATKMMRGVLPKILKAAEFENAILGLARELERTQRLINGLEFVIIPGYQEGVKFITATLEEREREDFVRLKHVKAVLERKSLERLE